MIKLIAGLGNPGSKYDKTRHNAGFLFLDYLVGGGTWSNEVKFHGVVASYVVGGNKVILLKPQTFMNKSGLSVGELARYYKIKTDEIVVAHDELDLSSGVLKLKKGGGHAGHNGLRDIIEKLGEKGFYRLRFGIGRPPAGKGVADFVLSNLSKQEGLEMQDVFSVLDSQLPDLVAGNVSKVMNTLNKK